MRPRESNSVEADILARVIQQERTPLPKAAAKAMLNFHFPQSDLDRMQALAVKNQEGRLTKADQRELDAYRRVGRLLDLLLARARLALHERGLSA